MSRRPITVARIVDALETIMTGATEDKGWAPAIRAAELLGRHVGMWKSDAAPRDSLAELINQAASGGDAEPPS